MSESRRLLLIGLPAIFLTVFLATLACGESPWSAVTMGLVFLVVMGMPLCAVPALVYAAMRRLSDGRHVAEGMSLAVEQICLVVFGLAIGYMIGWDLGFLPVFSEDWHWRAIATLLNGISALVAVAAVTTMMTIKKCLRDLERRTGQVPPSSKH
jgi:ABC-type dipeptide/oligopeptide/nickel transport system permease component